MSSGLGLGSYLQALTKALSNSLTKLVQQAQRIQGAQVGRLAQESHQVLQRTLQRQLVTQPLDHAGPPIVFYI